MLDNQIKQLFRYHYILIMILVLLIALSRMIGSRLMNSADYSTYLSAEAEEQFNDLVNMTDGMTLEQCAEYIDRQLEASYAQSDSDARLEALFRYKQELQNCFEVRGWRNFSRSGKGIVSLNMPEDLKRYPKKYREFSIPRVVNSDPFMKYVYLSSFSLMPVMIMLMVGVMSAEGYEKGIYRQVDISAGLKSFYKTKEIMLICLVVLLCCADQLSLMLISGIFERTEYKTAAVQSILGYGSSAFRASIFQVVIWVAARSFLSAMLCYNLFSLLAKHLRSVKKYILACAGIISIMSIAAVYIPELTPYMFAGITDTGNALYRLGYISRLDASEAPVVIISMTSVLGGVCQWRYQNLKELG